jgi:alpha-ketoglutaric semialdehyde dehydrogenase
MTLHPLLIAGEWRAAQSVGSFRVVNPATGEHLPGEYPVSSWDDCESALSAAADAAIALRRTPPETIAQFLMRFADRLEARKGELVAQANLETALPVSPRLAEVEFPRTTGQLRQAAAAAREGSWALPTIDTKLNIRSMLAPLGPVAVFGPNNFPFAFNGAAGGDFAAAIAAGNPVIAKGHPLHAGTTRMMAEEAVAAMDEIGLPRATVQLLYRVKPDSGSRLVADHRIGATAFTGSRAGGLALKSAADKAGKPIYLEMSSINPVVMLPGALAERGAKVAEEFTGSCLLGGGQFCTNPGLVILIAGEATEQFIADAKRMFESAARPPLLSTEVAQSLAESVRVLRESGAQPVTASREDAETGRYPNTLLRVTGDQFLAESQTLQTEAFGSTALFVVARDRSAAADVIDRLEGNLTGSIYSDSRGSDESLYTELAPRLREHVGRLLNDKMPTGVAVSPGMNHGGPFPATGHPGFTAVGIPAAMRRFGALHCYDNVRQHRLPPALRDENPNGRMWRLVDGQWTQAPCNPTLT